MVVDQFVDRTSGRADTFFDGPGATTRRHGRALRRRVRQALVARRPRPGVTVHDGGTVVVIQGPRFSTRAESRWFSAQGWDVVNMTQYPEAALACELELPYGAVGLVTDYDAGLEGRPDVPHVTMEQVFAFFEANVARVRERAVQRRHRPLSPPSEAFAGPAGAALSGTRKPAGRAPTRRAPSGRRRTA